MFFWFLPYKMKSKSKGSITTLLAFANCIYFQPVESNRNSQIDPIQSYSNGRPSHSPAITRRFRDIKQEKNHNIFLHDRVVKSMCCALADFVATGKTPQGMITAKKDDGGRCGWWKSIPNSQSEGSSGFKWVGCENMKGNEGSNNGNNFKDSSSSSSIQEGNNNDEDESELKLRLPSPEELERRLNATGLNQRDDDD